MLSEQSFDTGEIVINVAEGGPGGRPLVLLHGSTSRWQAWEELVPRLPQGWNVYAPDLRGHGKSGWAASGYGYDAFLPDTTALIERHVAEPVVLAGSSLGGSIALGIGAHRPDLVRAVILLDPALGFYRDAGLQGFPGPLQWYTWLDRTLASAPSFEDVISRCKERVPDNDAAALNLAQQVARLDSRMVRAMLENQTFRDYRPEDLLPRLACPALLLAGEVRLGAIVDDSDVALFLRSVRHGIAAQITDAGHSLLQEPAGQATLSHVRRFLASL